MSKKKAYFLGHNLTHNHNPLSGVERFNTLIMMKIKNVADVKIVFLLVRLPASPAWSWIHADQEKEESNLIRLHLRKSAVKEFHLEFSPPDSRFRA